MLLHFEKHAASSSQRVAWISTIWLILAFGVLRFAHVQRYSLLDEDPDMVLGRYSLGKSPVSGRRSLFFLGSSAVRAQWVGFG